MRLPILVLACVVVSLDACWQEPLDGMIDLHVHVAPGSRGERSTNAFDAARRARRAGMRALLIKNHHTETASQAYLVSQVITGIEVYGGIVLNRSVGGINPPAVESMASMTGQLGRMVWLPTFDSEADAPDSDNVPITRNGELLPEVRAVFEVMKKHDLALATGHVSPEESLLVIREARAAGIERIVVTHPGSSWPLEMRKEAVFLGALLEYTVLSVSDETFDEFVARIRAVGAENVVLTTDLGQPGNWVHVEGLNWAVSRLTGAGFSQAEIDVMTKRNPEWLLGLD